MKNIPEFKPHTNWLNKIKLSEKTQLKLEEIRRKVIKNSSFKKHNGIDKVEIAEIDMNDLPIEIKELIDRTKWETKKIFDFLLVSVLEEIEKHWHPESDWEIYFCGDWWMNVILWDKEEHNLDKWDCIIAKSWVRHYTEKLNNNRTTFFVVKFEKS